ncbi:general transcription factor 3C polypeptide 2 [Trichinella spiralis]|uniref:general transcription factor 3C polypeptide 2 n=1 Tax=Trichinella spiralis TaxID=6334 RepID=UPI0001EFD6F7|nr:general transcription factor 3C polypeptide 2 [Trichinella spiralis]
MNTLVQSVNVRKVHAYQQHSLNYHTVISSIQLNSDIFLDMFKKKTACACCQCLKRLHIAKNALLKQRQRRSCPLTGAAILFTLWVIFSQLNGAAHFMSFSPLYKRDLIASTIPTFHQQLN